MKTRAEWDKWAKKIRRGQEANLQRACDKLGLDHKALTLKRHKGKTKKTKKAKEPAPTGPDNIHGFACPVCWAVTESLRNDGKSIPRHDPIDPKAERYRDTDFCNGQGKTGRYVVDDNWEPGTKPAKSVTATAFLKGKV